MDRGACRATVHRVSKSPTQLKRLCMHGYDLKNIWGQVLNDFLREWGHWFYFYFLLTAELTSAVPEQMLFFLLLILSSYSSPFLSSYYYWFTHKKCHFCGPSYLKSISNSKSFINLVFLLISWWLHGTNKAKILGFATLVYNVMMAGSTSGFSNLSVYMHSLYFSRFFFYIATSGIYSSYFTHFPCTTLFNLLQKNFSRQNMDYLIWLIGLWRKLSSEELMLLNCGVGEDSWESLGLQGDPTSPF